jgi:hypothetical protein
VKDPPHGQSDDDRQQERQQLRHNYLNQSHAVNVASKRPLQEPGGVDCWPLESSLASCRCRPEFLWPSETKAVTGRSELFVLMLLIEEVVQNHRFTSPTVETNILRSEAAGHSKLLFVSLAGVSAIDSGKLLPAEPGNSVRTSKI